GGVRKGGYQRFARPLALPGEEHEPVGDAGHGDIFHAKAGLIVLKPAVPLSESISRRAGNARKRNKFSSLAGPDLERRIILKRTRNRPVQVLLEAAASRRPCRISPSRTAPRGGPLRQRAWRRPSTISSCRWLSSAGRARLGPSVAQGN